MKPAVLCINRSALNSIALNPQNPQGIFHFDLSKVNPEEFHFMNRQIVDYSKDEKDIEIAKRFPQVLPYMILKCGEEYLVYPRGKSGGESRLNDRLSLGFGGHIDLEDTVAAHGNITRTIERAVSRELFEEVDLAIFVVIEQFKYVLIDLTDEVGNVHAGFPAIIEVKKDLITASNEIEYVEWLTLDQIKEKFNQFENWSKMVIDSLLTGVKYDLIQQLFLQMASDNGCINQYEPEQKWIDVLENLLKDIKFSLIQQIETELSNLNSTQLSILIGGEEEDQKNLPVSELTHDLFNKLWDKLTEEK